ncbi:hypothetical protein AB0465_17900 [Streptomyces griseoviridis]|uniref:hypothetical protein n=1 Tax=Streptomyces griseoviridis TaxID=45398 RepID=UPI00344DFE08
MSEEPVSAVRQALAKALERGEVEAVVVHREGRVPAEVIEAEVELGVPVHLAGEESAPQ